ncbi:MAG: hypothetical protein AAGG46_00100 [Planctomycetota bacterium]
MDTRTDSQHFLTPKAATNPLRVTPRSSQYVDPTEVFCTSAPDPRVCQLFADRLRVNQHSLDRR